MNVTTVMLMLSYMFNVTLPVPGVIDTVAFSEPHSPLYITDGYLVINETGLPNTWFIPPFVDCNGYRGYLGVPGMSSFNEILVADLLIVEGSNAILYYNASKLAALCGPGTAYIYIYSNGRTHVYKLFIAYGRVNPVTMWLTDKFVPWHGIIHYIYSLRSRGGYLSFLEAVYELNTTGYVKVTSYFNRTAALDGLRVYDGCPATIISEWLSRHIKYKEHPNVTVYDPATIIKYGSGVCIDYSYIAAVLSYMYTGFGGVVIFPIDQTTAHAVALVPCFGTGFIVEFGPPPIELQDYFQYLGVNVKYADVVVLYNVTRNNSYFVAARVKIKVDNIVDPTPEDRAPKGLYHVAALQAASRMNLVYLAANRECLSALQEVAIPLVRGGALRAVPLDAYYSRLLKSFWAHYISSIIADVIGRRPEPHQPIGAIAVEDVSREDRYTVLRIRYTPDIAFYGAKRNQDGTWSVMIVAPVKIQRVEAENETVIVYMSDNLKGYVEIDAWINGTKYVVLPPGYSMNARYVNALDWAEGVNYIAALIPRADRVEIRVGGVPAIPIECITHS